VGVSHFRHTEQHYAWNDVGTRLGSNFPTVPYYETAGAIEIHVFREVSGASYRPIPSVGAQLLPQAHIMIADVSSATLVIEPRSDRERNGVTKCQLVRIALIPKESLPH